MKPTYATNAQGCWLWTRAKAGSGYGVTSFSKKPHYVHRVSFRLFYGDIPKGLMICHTCDNPACFNPAHLFAGTQTDNMRDMLAKKRGYAGPRNPYCKFSDEIIKMIRAEYDAGITPKDLRAAYGISHSQLWRITHRRVRA